MDIKKLLLDFQNWEMTQKITDDFSIESVADRFMKHYNSVDPTSSKTIQINHLTPYLAFNLMFDISHTGYGKLEADRLKYCKLIGLNVFEENPICMFKTNIKSQNRGMLHLDIDVGKPILRPMSDLVKEIEVNGKRFVPVDELKKMFNTFELHHTSNLLHFSLDSWISFIKLYGYTNKLFEWHFDVFGLIEDNLATNINTLK